MTEDEKKAEETGEEALAEAQRKRGEAIGAQELDDEALDMVSGGGTGNSCWSTEDCDNRFRDGCEGEWAHPNGEHMFDGCSTYYGCSVFHYCDQFAAIG